MGIKTLGMNEIRQGSERLNNYLKSIDEDLKNLQQAFNKNTIELFEKMKDIEKLLKERKWN